MSRRRLESIIEGRDPEAFARNVRRARERLGWTRQRLCREAGVSPQTLANVEGGRGCTPGVEHKLALALGTIPGRLWEPHESAHQILNTPAGDRWYFAGKADGERYFRAQGLSQVPEEQRFDPDAIQSEAERSRMGASGLARGFVRVTTAHLRAGSIVSSILEVFGPIDSDLPDGRLAYFHVVRGGVRFHVGGTPHEARAGDVFQAEMTAPAWLEPLDPVRPGEPLPLVVYVDVNARLNSPSG